ncbi:MAG: succinate dehydrogenase iron-sulfur subunit, partial [Anaerolineaceae bacterium]|nr:succinate dehydrogenase iron-sulfur subunit [Anaerolineaceae bacterium]
FDTFQIKAEPTDRVLDLLEYVRGDLDGTLSYRRSCAHGVCGSDAMRINGKNSLACKVLVQDLKTTNITVEPLLGFKVLKDLIVDMEPFFAQYRSVLPYLINDEPVPEKERLQTPEERLLIEDTTKCILCAACTTSCPSFWANEHYVGPAAIVNAHRFIYDSRDRGAAARLKVLGSPDGVWRCRTVFNCTLACPREIKITKAIADVKNTLRTGRLDLIEPIGEESEGAG